MKISLTTELACTLNDAWDALHNPEVFQAVSKPFLSFTPVSPDVFPLRYQSKNRYEVRALALGFIPMGHQEINPVSTSSADLREFVDNGRGLSGMLGLVTTFRHQMTLRPSGRGTTTLHDQLEFTAGVITPALWLGFRLFWWWRHLRMRSLVPQWHNLTTALWESRYQKNKLWTGSLNPTLTSALAQITPGTALDVGAGEGADALWLAEHGFDVTALDASPSALMRGEAERIQRVKRDGQPRSIRWIASDLLVEDLPASPKKYDLVIAHFVHLPEPERKLLWRTLTRAVAPGGTLVIVGHTPKDLSSGIPRPPAELMFGAAELRAAIPSSWKTVRVEETTRPHSSSGGTPAVVTDITLVATR